MLISRARYEFDSFPAVSLIKTCARVELDDQVRCTVAQVMEDKVELYK